MLDIKFLRETPDFLKKLCYFRKIELDIDKLLALDNTYRNLLTEVTSLRQRRNLISKQANTVNQEALELKNQLTTLEEQLKSIGKEREDMLQKLPNLIAEDTPMGESDKDNVEIAKWGEIPKMDFIIKSHVELGLALGILDLERGAKVSGNGFYYWVNEGTKLFNALYGFAEDFLIERGFIPLRTPVLTRPDALYGTGYLPFFDDAYGVKDNNLILIGTSEQSILPYRADEIIDASELPLLYCAFSPCFRAEAGAAGQATKGAFRVHQFHKLEQIVICHPDDSEYWHQVCQKNAEELMQKLKLAYRVVRVCSGDMGAPGYKKYDIECWFNSFNEYRETNSNTNLLDYQTRRMNIRCKSKNHQEKFFPHTISATAITDRALIAIIENNQTSAGTVLVPETLLERMHYQKELTGALTPSKTDYDLNEISSRDSKNQFQATFESFLKLEK